MVRTNAAIVRAAINGFSVRPAGVFACLIVISYVFVIFNIGGDKHFLKTMFLASLGNIYITPLKNNFGVYLPVAFNAQAYGVVVINIIPFIFHAWLRMKS
jgi:hypothetical protein